MDQYGDMTVRHMTMQRMGYCKQEQEQEEHWWNTPFAMCVIVVITVVFLRGVVGFINDVYKLMCSNAHK